MSDMSKAALPPPYQPQPPQHNEQQDPLYNEQKVPLFNEQQVPLYPPLNNEQQLPPPGPSQQIVYVTQPTAAPICFGEEPIPMTCQFCHTEMTTSVKVKPNTKTHLIALCLCCFVCWPCAWVPYVMDSCQSKKHYCSHCDQFLGVYSD